MSTAVLLSGGIDSTALAYWLRPKYAITVDYGQAVAQAEITSSRVVCEELRIAHEVVRADCSVVGAGNMLAQNLEQQDDSLASLSPTPEWWPFRNQLIVTLAAARVLALGVEEIIVGTVKTDRQHRDGLPEFVHLLDRLLGLQEGRLCLRAPAIDLDSVELVRVSKIPMRLLAWSHSCHRSVYACGTCRGCLKHLRVLADLGGEC